MRSLKKVISVMIVIALSISIFTVPTLAASNYSYEQEARDLYNLGLFRGVSQTEYRPNLGDSLIREEGAALVLRLFNLEEEANKMDEREAKNLLKEKFKDADKISSWAIKVIAYSVKNGIINGRPDGNFAPQDPLLGKEFAKMILEQLGQYYDFHTACADLAAISELTALEAIRFNDKELIRDDVVGISHASLTATYANGKTVLAVLSEDDEFREKAINVGLIEIVKVVSEIKPITITVGEDLELPSRVEVEYSDGSTSLVFVSWNTSSVRKNYAGEYKAIGTIDNFDGKIEVLVTVEEDVLEVKSVTADNLKEIVVIYNQDVTDNTSVSNKDNYSLNIGKGITNVEVNGNTAVLTVEDGVQNQRKAKLTISEKILETKEEIEFTFFDAKLPEVVDFQITGPRKIELTFTEPIYKPGSFNDVNVTVKSGSSRITVRKSDIEGEGTRTITVPLYASFVDGREYEVTVEGFIDYAGYKNKIETFVFEYEKDETPPVAIIEEAAQEYVKVTFNKPVTGLTKDHFSHTFTAWTAMNITKGNTYESETINSNDSVKTVYVWFYKDGKPASKAEERPIPEGETTFRILTKASGSEIKDDWGNKFIEKVYTIAVNADKTIPEVKEVLVTDEDEFTVEFTKSVTFEYDENLEILDENGKKIAGLTASITPQGSDKKFTVKLSQNLKGKVIIVNIKNVKDNTLNNNKLSFYSTTLEINDKTPPVLSKVNYEIVKERGTEVAWYLYIHFNEDLDANTALNPANYYLRNGETYTKLKGETEFYAGERIVKIALTKYQKGLIEVDDTELFVTNIKDVANNEITPKSLKIRDLQDSENAPYIVEALAIEQDTIKLIFNEELSTYDMDAFELKLYGVAKTLRVSSLDADLNSNGQTVLTLTFDGKVPYNTSKDKIKIVEPKAINNLFGVEPVALEANIQDRVKPEVISKNPIVVGNDGSIVIRFTEALNANLQTYMPIDLNIVEKYSNKTLKAGTQYSAVVNNTHEVVRIDGEDFDVYGKLIININSVSANEVYRISSKDSIDYIADAKGNTAKAFTKVVEIKGKDMIENAEKNRLAAAVSAAEAAIAGLPAVVEGAENATEAQEAIDAAQGKINAVLELNKNYDTSEWDAVILAQQAIVDTMKALAAAVSAAEAAIAGLPAAVEDAETTADAQEAIDAAQAKVDAVLDLDENYDTSEWDAVITAQQTLVDNIKALEAAIAAAETVIDELPEAVKDAENASAAQAAINAAQAKVDAVLDLDENYDTSEWDAVILAQQAIVDTMKALEEATEAVKKAEESRTITDVNAAQILVSALPDGEAKTSLQDRIDIIRTAEVKNAEELEAALNNEVFNKIVFKADITTDKHLYIRNANTVIDGKKNDEENFKLKASNKVVKDDIGRNSILIVEGANGVKISNLIIDASAANADLDGEDEPKWDSLYGLQIFNSTGVELNNLTLVGGDAGLLVNSSQVTVSNIKTEGNQFGGIEVTKSTTEGVTLDPELTITGTGIHDDAEGKPHIWIDGKTTNNDGGDPWVVDKTGEDETGTYKYTQEITDGDKHQLWFFNINPEARI